jgi:hypothetical protein
LPNEELTLSILRNIDTDKTQKTLSQELGVSKVNYVLKGLTEKGAKC